MLYLCIGYLEPAKMDTRSKDEMEKVMSECWPYLEELYQTGQVIMDAGLEEKKMSLRRVNGKVRAVDFWMGNRDSPDPLL